jgi:putative spermidine/putrescine transport system substrate-binding protein
MTTNSTIDKAAASKLPAVTVTPTFLSPSQATDAANYLAANWAKAVG